MLTNDSDQELTLTRRVSKTCCVQTLLNNTAQGQELRIPAELLSRLSKYLSCFHRHNENLCKYPQILVELNLLNIVLKLTRKCFSTQWSRQGDCCCSRLLWFLLIMTFFPWSANNNLLLHLLSLPANIPSHLTCLHPSLCYEQYVDCVFLYSTKYVETMTEQRLFNPLFPSREHQTRTLPTAQCPLSHFWTRIQFSTQQLQTLFSLIWMKNILMSQQHVSSGEKLNCYKRQNFHF